jgi:hypothetical protein
LIVFFGFLPGITLISLVFRALAQSGVTDDVGAGCGILWIVAIFDNGAVGNRYAARGAAID